MPLPALLAGDLAILAWELPLAYDALASAIAGASEGLRRCSRPAEVEIAEGHDAVVLAAPAWRTIEAAGGAATPFQRLAVADAASAVHLRRGEIPRVAIVRERGQPVVLFPTVVSQLAGRPTVRFLGDPMIQYGDLLAAPEAKPRHVEAAWRAAADPAVASAVYLRKVRADAHIAPLLARQTRTVAEAWAPFIDLRRTPPPHARDARELRRFRRRLSDQGEVRFELLRGGAVQPALRQALAFKRDWLTRRGVESSVIGSPEWEAVLATLSDSRNGGGLLCAARLTVNDRPAAIEIGFVHGRRWYAFLGAISEEFAKAGPGHVQMADTIYRCRADGLAAYDLMAPADRYKQAIATGAIAVRDHAVALGAGGRLATLAARSAPHVKLFLARLPRSLRRRAAAWIKP